MFSLAATSGARIPHAAGGDPYYDDVLLLLHGNGANNGDVFTDNSQYARAVTRIDSNVYTSTAESKFNGSSIYGSGIGNGFSTLTISELAGRNWCIECFIRRASTGLFGLAYFAAAGVILRLDGDSAGQGGTYKLNLLLSGALALESSAAIPLDTWAHIALTCEQGSGSNNTVRLFVDGVLDDSDAAATDSNLDLSTGSILAIGRTDLAGNYGINGYFAEYRLTLATRYTASFTPPTSPFPDF